MLQQIIKNKNNSINLYLKFLGLSKYKNFNTKSGLNNYMPNIQQSVNKQDSFRHITIPLDSFNLEYFIEILMLNLRTSNTYSILVKFGFLGNNVFYMSGSQIGVKISTSHDLKYYSQIYRIIELRIEDVIARYSLESLPNSIILSYKNINITNERIINKIKSLPLNRNQIELSKFNKFFSSNYLPLTINNSNFGYLIEGDLKFNYIKSLKSNIESSGQQIPDILSNSNLISNSNIFINKDKKDNIHLIIDRRINSDILLSGISYYTSNFNFANLSSYLLNNNQYLDKYIGINNLNISDKDNKDKFLNLGHIRTVYDYTTGICLCEAIDLKIDNESFIRTVDNYSLLIKQNEVVKLSRKINFDYLKSPYAKFTEIYKNMSNPNFGVLDIETYVDDNNISKVYNMGFATLTEKDKINTFYLSDLIPSLDSNLLIILCINSMLIPKYHNFIWYIHNMGNFDIIFIYKTLTEFNLQYNKDYYKLETLYKDNKMLRLIIKIKQKNNKYIKITFVDSLNILPGSLRNLAKDFNVINQKGYFPYSFVNKNNLNYKGETPDIKYFNDLSVNEYNEIYSNDNWSLKDQSKKYLEIDLLCLLEVLDKFNSSLFIDHNLQMTEGLTISRLALNKYLKYYLKDTKLPIINKLNYFNFFYFGYYGGKTEVFKPYGENLRYYDVNSLYPKAALNLFPGTECSYLESFDEAGLNLENLFGVFQAKVKTDSNYLTLLPVKTELGLTFPIGEFEGIWTSEELKYAKELGYQIKIIKGYNFNKIDRAFSDYVLELYDLKAKSTGSEKSINKSLLNNLFGRFGLNLVKPSTKTVNKLKLDYLMSTREIKSIQNINENEYLVTYLPIINEQICIAHGLDYIKVLSQENNQNIEKNLDKFSDVSIVISAFVTSYARIYMHKILLEILRKGGKIYYTDTDSIVTDISLEEIDPDLVGNDLGQFKLEYLIKEGYFISNKTYALLLNDNTTVIKAKGVTQGSLTIEQFKDMYYNNKNILTKKSHTIKDLSKGFVNLTNKDILLKYDSFLKRIKIYDRNGLWVDTKPITYNNITKSLTIKE